eukprot:7304663-Prymnesium_polylepis.1
MFWADHWLALPLQYAVYYLAEVGCKHAAAANECRAGLLRRGQLHGRGQQLLYNWKYKFIRLTVEEVCVRYKAKHARGGVRSAGVQHTPLLARRQIDKRG